jgi:folate-binding protein YgfZ
VSDGYAALRRGAALVDRSAVARIALAGADRRSLLHGLLTNDIEALASGAGCYAAWLTPHGRMITDVIVLELGDRVLLTVPDRARAPVLAKLDASIFTEDVTVEDVTGAIDQIGVDGPQSAATIASVFAPECRPLPLYGNSRWSFRESSVIVARTDLLGVHGYDLFVERVGAAALRDALGAAGAAHADREATDAVRVESGRPLFGADMDEETIPLEAGIEDRAISFTKGCYVGQEIIVRVLHRGGGRVARRLVGLTFDTVRPEALPPAGTPLSAGGREVGRLTSVVRSPALGRPIALGYVARDLAEPGTKVDVAGDGAAVVTRLPFVKET